MFDTFDGRGGAALATPAAVGSHTTFARRPLAAPVYRLIMRLSSVSHSRSPSRHYTALHDAFSALFRSRKHNNYYDEFTEFNKIAF